MRNIIFVAIADAAIFAPAFAYNILLNPGFEAGYLSPWYQSTDYGGPENWNVTGVDFHSGVFSATCVGNKELRQDFSPMPTSLITEVSFWVRDVDPPGFHAVTFFYSDNTQTAFTIDSTTEWQQFIVTGNLEAGKSLKAIGIFGYISGGSEEDRTYFDDAVVDVVPEPATLSTLGIALMMVFVRRRRR